MFDTLKNLYESEYVAESLTLLSSLNEGDTIAYVRDRGYGTVCAKLKSGTLPPGTSLDGKTGTITLSDSTAAANPSTGISGTPYDLEIFTVSATGETTWHNLALQFRVGSAATLAEGTLQDHFGDYTGQTAALYTVDDPDGLIDLRFNNGTALPPGLRLDQPTVPGPIHIKVDPLATIKAGTHMVDLTAVDQTGEMTRFAPFPIEFKDANAPVLYFLPARKMEDYYSATSGTSYFILNISDDADGGIAAATVRDEAGALIELANFGMRLTSDGGSPERFSIEVFDGNAFEGNVPSRFIHDPQEGTYFLPIYIHTTDAKGANHIAPAVLSFREEMPVDITVSDPDYLYAYGAAGLLARIRLPLSEPLGIVLANEPSAGYLDGLGLTTEVLDGEAFLRVSSNLSDFRDLDGNGWSAADTDDLRELQVNLVLVDSSGTSHPVSVTISLIDVVSTRTAEPVPAKPQNEYVVGDILGRVSELVPGSWSGITAISPNSSALAAIGLEWVEEQVPDLAGSVALTIIDAELFQSGLTAGGYALSDGVYERTFTVEGTHTMTGTATTPLTVQVESFVVDTLPEVIMADGKPADTYQTDDLLASVVEVTDGGIATIEVTTPEALSDLGLTIAVDNKLIARVKVADQGAFWQGLQNFFVYDNGQYTYTLPATVTDILGGTNDVEINLAIPGADTDALVSLAAAKYAVDYTSADELLVTITDAIDGGIVTATIDNSLLTTLGIKMGIEPGGIVRLKVDNPTTFRNAVSETNYELIPDFYRVELTVNTTDNKGGQSVSTFYLYVRSDEFVDSPAVIENQPAPPQKGALVGGELLVTFSDADGKLDPDKAVLKNANGDGIHLLANGLMFVENSTNPDHLDLIVSTATGGVDDFLAALGSDDTEDFRVCVFDVWDLMTELSVTLAVAGDQPAIGIVQHDPPEHENKLADNEVLFIFEDPDNNPAGISGLTEGSNSFSLTEAGLQINSDDQLAILTNAEFIDRLHAVNTVWTLDVTDTYYFLDVNLITTDQNSNTTPLTVQARVTKDKESQSHEVFTTPLHQFAYPGGARLYYFTDEDNGGPSANITTLTEGPDNTFTLAQAGLAINSTQEIVLTNDLQSWYDILDSGAVYTTVGDEYQFSFNVTTLDNCGGQTTHDLLFRVIADRKAELVTPVPDPKVDDAYRAGDVLATFFDLDGITYDQGANVGNLKLFRSSDGFEFNPVTAAGVEFVPIPGSQTHVEVKVHDPGVFVSSNGSSMDYRIEVIDDFNGTSSFTLTLAILTDTEATENAVFQHEGKYTDNQSVVTFSDAEDIDTVVVNSPSLSTLGLVLQDNEIKINGTAETWRGFLKSGYTEVGSFPDTIYRATINVTTTDMAQGTSTWSFNFDVQKDRGPSIIGGSSASNNEDAWKGGDLILDFSDLDGITYSYPTNIEALTLYTVAGPDETEVDPNTQGLRFVEVSSPTRWNLQVETLGTFLTRHTGTINYKLSIKDDCNGTGDLFFSVQVIADTESEADVVTMHEMAYGDGETVITFSDAETLTALNIEATTLSNLGLIQDGLSVRINGLASTWRGLLGSAPYTVVGTAPNEFYQGNIPVTTTDQSGGTSAYTVEFRVIKDQRAKIDSGPYAPKNEDDYRAEDPLLVFSDFDGITYDFPSNTSALTLIRTSDGATINPPSAVGLKFHPLNSTQIELRVDDPGVFVGATGSSMGYRVVVVDDFNASSEISFSLSVLSDSEAQAVVVTKHERDYGNNETVVSFTDADGLASISVNSSTLASFGLVQNGLVIQINGTASAWRSKLGAAPYTQQGSSPNVQYRGDFSVTTTDNAGGQTTIPVMFLVDKDEVSQPFPASISDQVETVYGTADEIVRFYDPDNPGAVNSGNVTTLTWATAGFTPAQVGLQLTGNAVQVISQAALRTALRDADSYYSYSAGRFSLSFDVTTTDQYGSSDSHTIVFPLTHAPADATMDPPTPEIKLETAYTDNEVILTFNDPDNNGSGQNVTSLTWLPANTFAPIEAGLRVDATTGISILTVNELKQALRAPGGPYTYNPGSRQFSVTFHVETTDQFGGKTPFNNITLTIGLVDQAAVPDPTSIPVELETFYNNGDVLMSFNDPDNPGADHNITALTWAGTNGFSASDIGLQINGSNQLAILTASALEAALRSATSEYTYSSGNNRHSVSFDLITTDQFNSQTTIPVTFAVTHVDKESVKVPSTIPTQSQGQWGTGAVLHSFTDGDMAPGLSPALGWGPGNSFTANDAGLLLINNQITIKSAQEFQDALTAAGTPYSYDAPTNRYSLTFNVTTTDPFGGTTQHSVSFNVIGDRAATIVFELGTKINSYFNDPNIILVTFRDEDGTLAGANAKLFAASAPEDELTLANEGFEWSNTGEDLNLKVLSSDPTFWMARINPATSKDFIVETTDPAGGTTTHNFTLSYTTVDRLAYATTVTKHEKNYDNEQANGLPVISFFDDDGIVSVTDLNGGDLSTMGLSLEDDAVIISSSLGAFEAAVNDPPYTLVSGYYEASLTFRVLDQIGASRDVPVTFRVQADRQATKVFDVGPLDVDSLVNGLVLFTFDDPDGDLPRTSAILTDAAGSTPITPEDDGLEWAGNGTNSDRLDLRVRDAMLLKTKIGGGGNSRTYGARLTDEFGGVSVPATFTISLNSEGSNPKEREPKPKARPADDYPKGTIITTIEDEDGQLLLAKTKLKSQGGSVLNPSEFGIEFQQNADGEAIDVTVDSTVGGAQRFTDSLDESYSASYLVETEDATGGVFDLPISIEADEPKREPLITLNDGKDKLDYDELEFLISSSDDFDGGVGGFNAITPDEESLSFMGLELSTDTQPPNRLELRIAEGRLGTFINSMRPGGFWTAVPGGWQFTFRYESIDFKGNRHTIIQTVNILDAGG